MSKFVRRHGRTIAHTCPIRRRRPSRRSVWERPRRQPASTQTGCTGKPANTHAGAHAPPLCLV